MIHVSNISSRVKAVPYSAQQRNIDEVPFLTNLCKKFAKKMAGIKGNEGNIHYEVSFTLVAALRIDLILLHCCT
jgi:hypothetical protein